MHYHYHYQHEPVVKTPFQSTAQYRVIDLLSDISEHEIPSLLRTGHIIQLIIDSKLFTS